MQFTNTPYGPGKYTDTLTEYLHGLTLDGGCQQETGNVSEYGLWLGLIVHSDDPITLLDTGETFAAFIVTEDTQGFVYSTGYATKEEAQAAFDDEDEAYSASTWESE